MSLGVNSDVEDQIQRCITERGPSRAIEVAVWMSDKVKPLLASCAVGELMMTMEAKGVLAFTEGRYEVVKQE